MIILMEITDFFQKDLFNVSTKKLRQNSNEYTQSWDRRMKSLYGNLVWNAESYHEFPENCQPIQNVVEAKFAGVFI